jgi:hypothetical protein
MAVGFVPSLLREAPASLEHEAAGREQRLERLDEVPGNLQAWLSVHYDQRMRGVARVRQKHFGDGPALAEDPAALWIGMDEWNRAVLGKAATRDLLFNAEMLRGAARHNPRILDLPLEDSGYSSHQSFDEKQGADLKEAARAIAAQHASDLRERIDMALSGAPIMSGSGSPASDLITPPTMRHKLLMDKATHGDLSSCAETAAEMLKGCDEWTLSRLAADSAVAWSKENFDPKVAALRGSLERDGRSALLTGLAASWRWGAGEKDRDRDLARRMEAQLRGIDDQLSALPEAGDPDRMLREDLVHAVTYDAALQVQVGRVAEQTLRSAVDGPEAGPDVGMDM